MAIKKYCSVSYTGASRLTPAHKTYIPRPASFLVTNHEMASSRVKLISAVNNLFIYPLSKGFSLHTHSRSTMYIYLVHLLSIRHTVLGVYRRSMIHSVEISSILEIVIGHNLQTFRSPKEARERSCA